MADIPAPRKRAWREGELRPHRGFSGWSDRAAGGLTGRPTRDETPLPLYPGDLDDRIQCCPLPRQIRSGQDILNAHKTIAADRPGLRQANIIKTGKQPFCLIAEWAHVDGLARARPNMIATLNSFLDALDDVGGGTGVTDAISGPVVLATPAGAAPA